MIYNSSSRGNALFLILIAVALFAALSFAFTSGSRNSGSIAGKEQARLRADEVIGYGNGLRVIVDRMILLGGASDINTGGNGVLFSASGANAAYGAVGAQPGTEVFNASGGKAAYQNPSPEICLSSPCSYEFTGQYTVTGVGSDGASELSMLVVDIDPLVCQAMNNTLGLGWSSIPMGGALTLTRFNGTNYGDAGGANPITLTGGANEFAGKRAFCYQESGGAKRYIYLHVLRAR